MAAVLADPSIYEFTGGEPPSEDELHERYQFLESQRSPDGSQSWLNWIVRERASGDAVGTMQATVGAGRTKADVAWIIGARWQGRGYGCAAAAAMVEWLGERNVRQATAHVNPGHEASRGVARAAGLTPTDVDHEGEQRWVRTFSDGR